MLLSQNKKYGIQSSCCHWIKRQARTDSRGIFINLAEQ
uniref:Uncharacterized protein n=1 Tax=Arundo donax TaxID=35708 RepID=A0A0A8ZIR7_ARUDO